MQRTITRDRQTHAMRSNNSDAGQARRAKTATVIQRRRSMARLRSAYFNRAAELAMRYSIAFDRLVLHLWRARHAHPRLLARHVHHVEDLVLAVACVDGDPRAWSDFAEHFERVLVRRGRDGSEDLEAMVEVRRFIASLRRDAMAGRSTLTQYAGTRPLRSWLAEAFAASKLRTRRLAFVLDPADSCCGEPLRFIRTGG